MTGTDEARITAEEILGLVHELPDTVIEKLIVSWDSGEKVTKYNMDELIGISGNKADRLSRLVGKSEDIEMIKAMFVTALAGKSRYDRSRNEIELVWTGPLKTSMRNTKQVMEDMLRSAKKKVTIVDYQITSKAKSIIDELTTCLDNGVKVDLIVDNYADGSTNKSQLAKCFAEKSLASPRIFTRDLEKEESKFFKVHAKVMIVDDTQMLIGSANLTELGTEVNFELGVLIRGPAVKETLELLDEMIRDKYFEEPDDK